jgi:hypothetical protein
MGPPLGSILLASTDPERLRAWYAEAFDAVPNRDGFLQFGGVAVLIDQRDDVAERNPEPGRVVINFHVDDVSAAARAVWFRDSEGNVVGISQAVH